MQRWLAEPNPIDLTTMADVYRRAAVVALRDQRYRSDVAALGRLARPLTWAEAEELYDTLQQEAKRA